MKNLAPSSKELFHCGRCGATFEERPLCCPNCDSLQKQRNESKSGGSLFKYILFCLVLPLALCIPPILLGPYGMIGVTIDVIIVVFILILMLAMWITRNIVAFLNSRRSNL